MIYIAIIFFTLLCPTLSQAAPETHAEELDFSFSFDEDLEQIATPPQPAKHRTELAAVTPVHAAEKPPLPGFDHTKSIADLTAHAPPPALTGEYQTAQPTESSHPLPIKLTPGQTYYCSFDHGTMTLGVAQENGTITDTVIGRWRAPAFATDTPVTQSRCVTASGPVPIDIGLFDPLPSDAALEEAQKTAAQAREAQQAVAHQQQEELARQEQEREQKFQMRLKALTAAGVDLSAEALIAFTGKVRVWEESFVRVTGSLSNRGIFAQGYMPHLKLGPLMVTGAGPDGIYGTDDDGLIVELTVNKDVQRFMLSGLIELFNSQAQAEVYIGSQGIDIFAELKVLNKFLTTVVAKTETTGTDLDFTFTGMLEADFNQFMTLRGTEEITKIAKSAEEKIKDAREAVKKLQDKLNKLNGEKGELATQIAAKKAQLATEVAEGEKRIQPAQDAVDTLLKETKSLREQIMQKRAEIKKQREVARAKIGKLQHKVDELKQQIEDNRRIIANERKDATAGLTHAQQKVAGLDREVRHAEERFHHYNSRRTSRTCINLGFTKKCFDTPNVGNIAQATFWGGKRTAIQAARAAAQKALEVAQKAVASFPIDADPRIAPLFAAYEPATAALNAAIDALSSAPIDADPQITALFAAYQAKRTALPIANATLDAARLAANPAVAKTALEITGLEVAKVGLEATIETINLSLDSAQTTLRVAEAGFGAVGTVMTEMTKVMADGGQLFAVKKGALSFSMKETLSGKTPRFFMQAIILGKEKNFDFSLDLTRPETFITELSEIILTVMDPNYRGDTSMLATIEELKQEQEKRALAHKERAAEKEKEKKALEQKQREQEKARTEKLAALKKEQEKQNNEPVLVQNEGEFGKKAEKPVAHNVDLSKQE